MIEDVGAHEQGSTWQVDAQLAVGRSTALGGKIPTKFYAAHLSIAEVK